MDYDVLDPDFWNAGMLDRLDDLRHNQPVYWDAKNELWVLSKHADIEYASLNPKIFCSGEGTRPNMPIKLSLVDMDEPRHGQIRGLVNKGFTPRMVSKLEAAFRTMTTERVDDIAGSGECDIVDAISMPLPLQLIAELIGIPVDNRDTFRLWIDQMFAADGRYDDPEVMRVAGECAMAFMGYMTELLEERRKEPKDDLLSILVAAKDQNALGMTGDEMDPEMAEKLAGMEFVLNANDELNMFLIMLVAAGNDTTRNAITGGIAALIEHPEQLARLSKNLDDAKLMDTTVEEIVRWVSPVESFARTLTEDASIRGVDMKAGQKIFMLYGSANRDEEVFEDPTTFRIDRDPNPHLGFGIGNHYCLGASLARMEIRVVLQELLSRCPDLTYSEGGPTLVPSPLVRGYGKMMVRYTPEATQGRDTA